MLKTVKKYPKNLTIKFKLLLINMVLAVLPVAIFGALITSVYQDSVNKRTRRSVEDTNVVMADRITRILKDAENCSNYLTVNINKVMDGQENINKMTMAQKKAVTNELYVGKIVFDEIDSIAFINADNKVFVSDNTLLTNVERILQSDQLAKLEETSGKSIWFPSQTRDFLVQDSTVPVLTLGKKILQINTGKTLGYIFVNVNIRTIENILMNQLINYQLLDNNKTIISSVISSNHIDESDLNEMIKDSNKNQLDSYKNRTYYYSSYDITDYGWELVGITDLNEFNVEGKKILYLIILTAIAAIFLETFLSSYLTRVITVPLRKLKSGAEEIAGGNMNLRLHFKNNDEIGQLGKSFNYMAEQVQELLVKVDYEARKKQEYELSLLHEQVKPHFLYNSLDIIIKLSEMNRNRESRRAIRRLADYYRNSLSDSKKIITIAQEIKIAEDYLELQKIRYNDLFSYEVEVEESISQMLIPKLTLQPLVENAIYHGFKYKEETGILRITGMRKEEHIILSVSDNGAGMNKDGMEAILQNKPEGHFGVYSVNHRIKLFFGEEYGIVVHSQSGEGTTIDIILPVKSIEEEYV
jgi:two-component system sensor histidine kinase YesM